LLSRIVSGFGRRGWARGDPYTNASVLVTLTIIIQVASDLIGKNHAFSSIMWEAVNVGRCENRLPVLTTFDSMFLTQEQISVMMMSFANKFL
jgi:hypothetical protein